MTSLDVHFVYLVAHRSVSAEVGPVKVGFTKYPEKRLAALQTGNPSPLAIVFTFQSPSRETARLAEVVFHQVADAHRMSGEWFDMQPMEALNALTKVHLGIIATDMAGDPGASAMMLEWCGVNRAAELWGQMQEDAR